MRPSEITVDERPDVIIWEPTRACELACLHCRSAVQPIRSRFELSTYESYKLIDQIATLQPQSFVLTGGDPLEREDIHELVDYARRRGLASALTPSATSKLTDEAIEKLASSGLAEVAFSLDGSTPEIHDGFRGIAGSFDRTTHALWHAREQGLRVQIHTTVTRSNVRDVDAMSLVLEQLGIEVWRLFFPVPAGRGKRLEMINAKETEEVFGSLWEASQRVDYQIKVVEADHYRRFVVQKRLAPMNARIEDFVQDGRISPELDSLVGAGNGDSIRSTATTATSGRSLAFISHIGEVYPSGFLPLSGGNVRSRSLSTIYRTSPLFVALRDTSLLKGKCGACEFRDICGGSRARAWATSGDPLGEEPLCAYVPAATATPGH